MWIIIQSCFFFFESGYLTLEQKMNFKTYDLKILHPWGNFKKKGHISIKMNAKKNIFSSLEA